MNIGIDARSLGPMKTGVGTYVSEILRHWPENQDDDSFTLFSHQAISYPESATVLHSVTGSRWGLPWYVLRSGHTISQKSLSVFWGAQGLLPLRLSEQLPAVVTIHDCIHQQGICFAPSILYNWTHRCLLPSALRRAKKILVVSRFVADEVMRHLHLPASKIEVTPLGVRAELFGAKAKASATPCDEPEELENPNADVLTRYSIGRPFILAVGTLEPRKNLKVLLEAFAALPRNLQSRLQLVLTGKPGWGTNALRRYLQSYPQRCRVVLTGYVSDEDLRSLYASAEMFVFPSFYEGFGLPVLEAMASGCPVIAANRASLKEVGGSAAIFVDPQQPAESWSQAISRLAESAELKNSMTQAGLERARLFSWESCASTTAAVLRRAV